MNSMADLLALLSQAGSSLGAHRAASATASHNLSNANTPGYSRQSAALEALLPAERLAGGFIGRGASLAAVTQARDRFLESQIPSALAQSARSSTQSETLASVSVLDPDGSAGLSAALGGFYSSLRALSQNPGDLGLRQAVVASTRSLTLSLNRTWDGLASARTGLDQKLGSSATEVNALTKSMADLNRKISIERASGSEPNDLLDARQRAQDRLAELTGATPVSDAQGNVGMALSNGAALVSGFNAAAISTRVDVTNSGHLEVRMTAADGSSTTALPASAMGGTLGGMLDARDGALRQAESQLDTMTFDLAGAVNTVHRAGFGLDGGSGRDLLTVGTTATGSARSIQINALVAADPRLVAASTSASAPTGDGSNVLALMGTERQALSTGSDVIATFSNIVAGFGSFTQSARAASEHDGAIKEQLQRMRESASGVSIDEEMVNMTRAQRAFEAVAKVMKTTDEMLETLMSLK
jgi:flagellar hook-associated protein 1 FlgK